MDGATTQAFHDWLLTVKPDGAEHDAASCPLCTEAASKEGNVSAEETGLTQEQHSQLLEAAVEKATAEAKAEADAEILRLNEALETAQSTINERDAKIDELSETIAKRDEADRLEAVAAERVEKVKEVANFSDEQIEARRGSWARLTDDDFDSLLADYKSIMESAAEAKEKSVPDTDFNGTREKAGKGSDTDVIRKFLLPAGDKK